MPADAKRMTFAAWCDALNKAARQPPYNYEWTLTDVTGEWYWEDCYEDGESPEVALAEDWACGED